MAGTEYWVETDIDYGEYVSYLNEYRINPTTLNTSPEYVTVKAGEMIIHLSRKYIEPKYNPLIFGKNSKENIVSINVTANGCFLYMSDGSVEHMKDYSPWVLTNESSRNCIKLKGQHYWRYMSHIPYDKYNELEFDRKRWSPRSIEEGFMMLHGFTYFKGMKFEQLSVLSFDIETTTLDPNHEDAQVILISSTFRDSKGNIQKHLFKETNKELEAQMIESWCDKVLDLNPDVIIGHNIMIFDLPYLNARAKGKLHLGRHGEDITFEDKISKYRKDGSQSYDYHNAKIAGREIVDTFFLSLKYDIGRQFPSYGLKQIEKHLNLVDSSRIEWDFAKNPVRDIIKKGGQLWEDFCKYCSDDSDNPIKMWDIMAPSFFYMTQAIPKTFQEVINQATGSQLDGIMIRSYLQDGWSQPKTSAKTEYEGAISMGIPGVYENVRKVDVASLYPSIMLQYNIYDKVKDPNKHMLIILDYFRTDRLKNKKLAKETGEKYYDDLQASAKIFINSLYGFLGANYLLYNYPFGASEVTRRGRDILLLGVEWATGHTLRKVVKEVKNEGKDNEEEKFEWVLGDKVRDNNKGFRLVNTDTDSFSYTNGGPDFDKEVAELNSLYPELIKWEDDGEYQKVIVLRAKNYILQDDKGKVKTKGSSITDTKREPILRNLIKEIIDGLVKGDLDLPATYKKYCDEAIHFKNIHQWCVKKTVTKSILHPERANEQKPKDAIDEAISKGIIAGIQEGDKIFLYQAINGEKQKVAKGEPQFYKDGRPMMVANTILRYPELWSEDQDVWHYVERVFDTVSIFSNVLDVESLTKYHLKKNRNLLTETK